MRGRNEESLSALSALRRRPTSDDQLKLEWKGILLEVQFQKEALERAYSHNSALMLELKQWRDLFRPKSFKRTAIALGIPFFQQVMFVCFPALNVPRLTTDVVVLRN